MGLQDSLLDESMKEYILDHTLIRKVEHFDTSNIHVHTSSFFSPTDDKIRVDIPKRCMPNQLPPDWDVVGDSGKTVHVEIKSKTRLLIPDSKASQVTSAGQLPTGYDPSRYYPNRSHPRGLQLAVLGASDAVHSLGIPWDTLRQYVNPDEVSVYAGSALGQCDSNSFGGLLQAPFLGKRPTSKQSALGLVEMPADFVNAYVLGTLGGTAGVIGACATFLYNVKQGVEDIIHRDRRISVVGGAEAPIIPEFLESFRIMGALAEDETLRLLDGSDELDNRRACRPFSSNAGFTFGEGAVYTIFMDEELALETGVEIYGSVPEVAVNADGFKKSIPGPGVGNYITVAKALAIARAIVGDESLKHRSCVHAHGTGTPQNRVTESHILNELAKTFGIERWPVAAIKAYLGHTLGPASGDQLTSVLGTWKHGILPGIASIDHIADDVFQSNLRISPEHLEVGEEENFDVALVNSKGFGGNNATGVMLSPEVTKKMLRARYGRKKLAEYEKRAESTRELAAEYDQRATQSGIPAIYQFGEGVLEGKDLEISRESLAIPGWDKDIDLNLPNPYEDMMED